MAAISGIHEGASPRPCAECGDLKSRFDTSKRAPRPRTKARATARSFAILEHVATFTAPVDMLDIIAAVNLPKATAYRLVDWFVGRAISRASPDEAADWSAPGTGKSCLQCAVVLGAHSIPRMVLQRLVHTVNETCNIGTLLNGEVVVSRPGRGRALAIAAALCQWLARAAALQRHRQTVPCASPFSAPKRLLQSLDLRRYTDSTITDCDRLDVEFRQIRKEQVSFDRQEYLVGVVCMASR